MLIKLYKIRALTLLLSTLFLCQCTAEVNSSVPETPTPAAPVLKKKKPKNPYVRPVSAYLTQANQQEGTAKQIALISAAGRALSEGHLRQGVAILAQTRDLTSELADEKNILLAQAELMRDQPKMALNKLNLVGEKERLPPHQQVLFHELLAQAYRATERPMESITERMKLEPLLSDEDAQKNNQRKLWLTLTHLSEDEITQHAATVDNKSELQGWLQLSLIPRKYRDNPRSLLAALDQWQRQFNNHPANNILPTPLDSVANKLVNQPKQIALLLPLSGPLQGPGTAIRDGFMAAYQSNNAEATMKVKTYDTNQGEVTALYESALNEGADYVIGPLTKPQVAAVAALPHPVPTLLLNDSTVSVQENSYSFGLSPLNEAIQVAMKAGSKGYRRALIIAPGNEWGNEVAKAFTNQWHKQQGQVVDTFLYGANEDLNKKMKDFLHVSDSQQREKRIKELLGYNIESVINRRQDFDMIFLLAYPSKARQIMPLLNYYYAADVPVFATASVYGGSANALKDKDLDGLIFCDIPWVFAHQAGTRNWPEQFNSYNRLYALGKDSYSLATQLNHLILFPADESHSGDGILYLNASQQVARVLEWGQFKQGLVHSLGEMA